MKKEEYIEQEESDLYFLEKRLEEIKSKWIKFGLREEEVFLEEYIKLKKEMIEKLIRDDKGGKKD